MNRRIDDIRDDELRIIGPDPEPQQEKKTLKWLWPIVAGVILVALAILAARLFRKPPDKPVADVFDQSTIIDEPQTPPPALQDLGDYSDTTKAYTEHLQQTVNDISLDIYIPHNATPILALGTPDINDKSIVFVTQAADIRADNGKINGFGTHEELLKNNQIYKEVYESQTKGDVSENG